MQVMGLSLQLTIMIYYAYCVCVVRTSQLISSLIEYREGYIVRVMCMYICYIVLYFLSFISVYTGSDLREFIVAKKQLNSESFIS